MTGWLITATVVVVICYALLCYGLQKLVGILSRP